jgi:dolichol-phosphate mannosyltransferase
MLSIILPTYNERENIVPLIEAIDAVVRDLHEIIVVDDDSPDGTWRIVEEYGKTHPHVRVERRMTDHGLTKSLQRGIDTARGDVIAWMDCDFSHPPAVLSGLLAKIAEGNDIAVASRFVAGGQQKTLDVEQGDSRLAILISSAGCAFMRVALFPSFRDYTSGFIAAKRDVLRRIRLRGAHGEYFIDLIVRAKLLGYRIVEIPFVSDMRRTGTSKTAPTFRLLLVRCVQYGWQLMKMEVLRLKHFFGRNIAS